MVVWKRTSLLRRCCCSHEAQTKSPNFLFAWCRTSCGKVGSWKLFKTWGMWSVSLHALGSLARGKIKRLVHCNALTFSSCLNEEIKRKNKVRSELWGTNMEAGCWFDPFFMFVFWLLYFCFTFVNCVCFHFTMFSDKLIQVKEGKIDISPNVRWQYWIFNGRCEFFRCIDLISCLRNEWETDSLSKGGHYWPSYWLVWMKAN